jgi:IS30 family transposase
MPQSRLSPSDDDFIMNMKKVQYSNREIARKLKVSEGTIRYRIKREQSGREDSRKRRPSLLTVFGRLLGSG